MQYQQNNSKPKPKRLGEPLGNVICAHSGGNAARLLVEIQTLDTLNLRGIGIRTLEKHEMPPSGSVYLRDVEAAGATKFSLRPIIENGVTVIDVPAVNAVMKPKRIRVNAGMILATVDFGNNWCDRSGHVHKTTLCAPAQ